MDDIKLVKRKLEREVRARREAEQILEKKALELFHTNEKLKKLNEDLEHQVEQRTEALIASEGRYRQIIENASDLIYRATPKGIITYVNPVGQRMLGYDLKEVLGLHFSVFVHKDYLEEVADFYADVIYNKRDQSYFEFPLIKQDGEIVWYGQNLQLIYTQEGEIQEVSAVARDITERKKIQEHLRKSEEKYRGIIENMALGLLEVDLNSKIVSTNNSFCEMTGYTAEELMGKDADTTLIPPEFQDYMDEQNEARKTGHRGVYEIQLFQKSGQRIWVLISGSPIYNPDTGEQIGSMGMHYNITKRKKLEHDLAEAKRVAEAAQEAEKQFLARMSHEIRTPLNAIIGMSHLLYDTHPSKEQKELLSIIKSSADILQALISDILEISKIHAGEITPNPKEFDLAGVVKSIQKTFQHKLEHRPIEVTGIIDPEIQNLVIGDDLLLNQILLNLMGNASKFTEKGEIGITAKIREWKGDQMLVDFCVYDTGIGISEDKLDLIFESFKQADQDIRHKFGGTGLGLAITKQLVNLQGGEIRVESEPGKGTSFLFSIPYQDTGILAEEKTEELPNSAHISVRCNNVLIAEDNLMNRKYISSLFKKWDLPYKFAHNGKEAVELAKEEQFDLIFMDISMPVMNGYEATIGIRNTHNPNQHIPIIALTASALVDKRDKAFEIGMTDYLPKPFRPLQLLQMIQKYLPSKNDETMDNSLSAFQFNPDLDIESLEMYYEDDLEYAKDMFETFIMHSATDFDQLRPLAESQQWDELKKLAHKLKPSFAMVGIGFIGEMMAEIEVLSKENPSLEIILPKLKILEVAMNKFVPILKNDLHKMEQFVDSV